MEWTMFRYFKNKIFRQHFLIIFIIIFVTFAAIALVLLMFTWHSLEEQQLQMADSYRQSAAVDIHNWIQGKELNLKYQALFLEKLGQDKLASAGIRDLLIHQWDIDPSMDDIFIMDSRGTIINSKNNDTNNFKGSELPFFKDSIRGQSIITGLFSKQDTQFLMISEPIYYQNRPSYLLVGVINLESLALIIEKLDFGTLGHAYLINRDGKLLTRVAVFDYYRFRIHKKENFTLANSFAVQQILRKKNGKAIYRDFSGRKVLGSFEWMESLQAGLIVELSDYKVMQPLYLLLRVIAFLAIAVGLLGLFMAYIVSRKTTSHLHELVNAASNIANQDYRQPLTLVTNTELDILIDQFNQMQTAIRTRERNLQEKNLELKAERSQALEATKMKSQFLANMSHELRTPLNSIIGFTGRVIKKCGNILPPVQLENLEIVKSEAQNLMELINDLLDLSKIEAGRMEVNVEEFDLAEIIREAEHIIQPLQESKQIGYVRNLFQNTRIPITSDRVKVKQILINLLSNAFKYSEKGTVTLSVEKINDGYRIAIQDEGIGIAADNIRSIFDEFRQIDGSYTRKVGGTGLGLSITKNFVQMLQGRIQVASVLGVGSTFTVELPMGVPGSAATVEQPVSFGIQPFNPFTIKVVCIDDDPNVCMLYKQYLEEVGFEVITFNNGENVVERIAAAKADIVLLDIMIPHKDGWEILAELKNNNKTRIIPVIMISVLSEKNLAYDMQADEYLIKPVTQTELTSTIDRVISSNKYPEVLVADDDENYLKLISQILVDESISFRLARDGEQTLQMIAERKPDLLLLDIMMPNKDGLAVLDEVQKNYGAQIAIVLVTSKVLTQNEIRGLKNKVSQFIEKSGSHVEKIMNVISRIIKEKEKASKGFD
jgi:signal transduction histidine kinase/DNA-binding response OmpR family regulator